MTLKEYQYVESEINELKILITTCDAEHFIEQIGLICRKEMLEKELEQYPQYKNQPSAW